MFRGLAAEFGRLSLCYKLLINDCLKSRIHKLAISKLDSLRTEDVLSTFLGWGDLYT
jgi:hypothetical protein